MCWHWGKVLILKNEGSWVQTQLRSIGFKPSWGRLGSNPAEVDWVQTQWGRWIFPDAKAPCPSLWKETKQWVPSLIFSALLKNLKRGKISLWVKFGRIRVVYSVSGDKKCNKTSLEGLMSHSRYHGIIPYHILSITVWLRKTSASIIFEALATSHCSK